MNKFLAAYCTDSGTSWLSWFGIWISPVPSIACSADSIIDPKTCPIPELMCVIRKNSVRLNSRHILKPGCRQSIEPMMKTMDAAFCERSDSSVTISHRLIATRLNQRHFTFATCGLIYKNTVFALAAIGVGSRYIPASAANMLHSIVLKVSKFVNAVCKLDRNEYVFCAMSTVRYNVFHQLSRLRSICHRHVEACRRHRQRAQIN